MIFHSWVTEHEMLTILSLCFCSSPDIFAQDYSGEVLRRQSLKSSGGWLSTWNKAGFLDLFPKSMDGFRFPKKVGSVAYNLIGSNWQRKTTCKPLLVLAFWGVIYATYQTHLLGEQETTIVSQDFFEKVTDGQAINTSL